MMSDGSDGAALLTVTDTPAVVLWPAASCAFASSACGPFETALVFHVTSNGADVLLPTSVPSALSSTSVTPTLSAAEIATPTEPLTVAPATGEVIDTVGLSVSTGAGGGLFTVTEIGPDTPALPA